MNWFNMKFSVGFTLLSTLLFSLLLVQLVGCRSLSRRACDSDSYEKVKDDNLEQLFIIMRHGVRAPWTSYPLDPNFNNTGRWPNGRSQLTEFGIEQSSNVGRLLKIRYAKFLQQINDRRQVFLRSSPSQRCFDTLNLVTQKIIPEFKQSKIPVVYSLPKEIDSVLYEEPYCPVGDQEDEENLHKNYVQEYESSPQIQELYKYVSNKTGLPATMSGITKAFDCLRCDRINGYRLPKWAKPNDLYNRMGDVLTKQLQFIYSSQKSQRLRAGPFLQELVEEIEKFRLNQTEKVLNFYTTHDVKIAAIIQALGTKLYRYPPFASALLFEVYRVAKNQDQRDYEIKVYYISQTEELPYGVERLHLNDCLGTTDYQCTFSKFYKYLQPLINVNWNDECGLSNSTFDPIQAAEDGLANN